MSIGRNNSFLFPKPPTRLALSLTRVGSLQQKFVFDWPPNPTEATRGANSISLISRIRTRLKFRQRKRILEKQAIDGDTLISKNLTQLQPILLFKDSKPVPKSPSPKLILK